MMHMKSITPFIMEIHKLKEFANPLQPTILIRQHFQPPSLLVDISIYEFTHISDCFQYHNPVPVRNINFKHTESKLEQCTSRLVFPL